MTNTRTTTYDQYESYWIEARLDGDYLMTFDVDHGDERKVDYLGDGCSLADALRAADADIDNRS